MEIVSGTGNKIVVVGGDNERELLLSVGGDEDDINEILEYVNGFDFERKRKDRCLK